MKLPAFIGLLLAFSLGARGQGPKNAAVLKVISMLEDLQKQVIDEGEQEAKSYNKLACFCKDSSAEKQEAINEGESSQTDLSASLSSATADRNDHDREAKKLEQEIVDLRKEMTATEAEFEADLKELKTNLNDVHSASTDVNKAESTLQATENAVAHNSFLQTDAAKQSARRITELAETMGLATQPQEGAEFHADKIMAFISDLKASFTKEEDHLTKEEMELKHKHQMFEQDRHGLLKRLTTQLDRHKEGSSKSNQKVAADSEMLTTVSANLNDDKSYMNQLNTLCTGMGKTWKQRSQMRYEEVQALTQAINIVKDSVATKTENTVRLVQKTASIRLAEIKVTDEDAMNNLEAEAESVEEAPSLLQRASSRGIDDATRNALFNLFRDKGNDIHSTMLLSLANQARADPFAKIKQLIAELIKRLLTEAADEGNQKAWCDKSMGDAKQLRDDLMEKIGDLNAEMASLEARDEKLTEELATLSAEMAQLNKTYTEAEADFRETSRENNATIEEAKAGLQAINMAIDTLQTYYKKAGNAKVALAQGPLDGVPDAGFSAGEAYTGAQGASGGILGMMDVIKSDFERTLTETKLAQDAAAKEFDDLDTETQISMNEKRESTNAATSELSETKATYDTDKTDLDSAAEGLAGKLKELISLQGECVDTGMSYEERVARREDEIESLKKGLCILEKNGAEDQDEC